MIKPGDMFRANQASGTWHVNPHVTLVMMFETHAGGKHRYMVGPDLKKNDVVLALRSPEIPNDKDAAPTWFLALTPHGVSYVASWTLSKL